MNMDRDIAGKRVFGRRLRYVGFSEPRCHAGESALRMVSNLRGSSRAMPTYKGGTLRAMAELGSCTKCGAPLRPGYGAGLCPACLLQQALVDGDGESSSATDLSQAVS